VPRGERIRERVIDGPIGWIIGGFLGAAVGQLAARTLISDPAATTTMSGLGFMLGSCAYILVFLRWRHRRVRRTVNSA
jgi:uncharacterized membrane protein HdeD (DUF308 family)